MLYLNYKQLQTLKCLSLIVILLLTLGLGKNYLLQLRNNTNKKTSPVKVVKVTAKTGETPPIKIKPIKKSTINYRKIPLRQELKDYVKKQSKIYGVEESLLFAVLKKESSFNPRAINLNNNGSVDYGIAQINSRYADKFAKAVGIKKFEKFNPYHGIKICAYLLSNHKSHWSEKGLKGDYLTIAVVNSYNLGRYSYQKNFISRGKLNRNYSNKVLKYKKELALK